MQGSEYRVEDYGSGYRVEEDQGSEYRVEEEQCSGYSRSRVQITE